MVGEEGCDGVVGSGDGIFVVIEVKLGDIFELKFLFVVVEISEELVCISWDGCIFGVYNYQGL